VTDSAFVVVKSRIPEPKCSIEGFLCFGNLCEAGNLPTYWQVFTQSRSTEARRPDTISEGVWKCELFRRCEPKRFATTKILHFLTTCFGGKGVALAFPPTSSDIEQFHTSETKDVPKNVIHSCPGRFIASLSAGTLIGKRNWDMPETENADENS
jgi:hypothetical protein